MVTTLGHVETYKNPFVWIEVARKCIENNPSIKLSFVWAGDGTLFNDCVKKVNSYGLNREIRFIGPASNTSELLCRTDIYFQPSLIESFGLSVLEAMSNHRPCVVSNRGGLPEVVTDEVSGFLVDPDDIENMSLKINLLVQNQKIREDMGRKAYNQYMTRFSKPVWENKMLDILNKVI
jgi:glycosyltransferase involved in cell wall biosynthesis